MENDKLLEDPVCAMKLVSQEPQFSLINGVPHIIDHRHGNQRRIAVPTHLRERYSERPMAEHMVDTSPVISCITRCSSTDSGKECTPISLCSANDVQTVQ